MPLALIVASITCLLVPFGAGLVIAGALGGVLGFLGIPWLMAAAAVVVVLAFALLASRRKSRQGR